MRVKPLESSFRDVGNYVYQKDNTVYRQINKNYADDYKHFIVSGLYDHLSKLGHIVKHKEVSTEFASNLDTVEFVLRPEQIDFITYPYEWCFSQIKDAALLTLDICIESIEYGMIIKDASAYNIQFQNGRAIFIDTGSFKKYNEGDTWDGYQQFCKHFVSPLLLASKKDIRFFRLLEKFIDGIPLDLTSKLLGIRGWLSWHTLIHIHLHALSQKKYSNNGGKSKKIRPISKMELMGLLHSLRNFIKKINWNSTNTEWGEYYCNTNYLNKSSKTKKDIVSYFTKECNPSSVLDLGSNNGLYSRVAGNVSGAIVVSCDVDPVAVENNYINVKKNQETNILPIMQDLTSPSSGAGWAGFERCDFTKRVAKVDMVMCLALIHHLAISNNVPLLKIAEYLARFGKFLLIEFVPKSDSQVKKLLLSREDVFPEYNIDSFETEFGKFYNIIHKINIIESERTLFLMRRSNL